VIGHADVVAGSRADVLQAFHAQRYGPRNVVLAAAGSVDHDALVELALAADAAALPHSDAPLAPPPPDGLQARVRFVRKDTEQYHVCLGAPGIARDDDRRWALRVLDNVLGGTTSSRLFQEVRERRGLAYSVYSFSALHAGAGQVGLYVGTRPDNVGEALRVVGAELERFVADPATEDELARSKENVKGRTVLSLESTSARMNRLGSSVLAGMPVLSVDEIIERVDAVTMDDVRALAASLFAPERLSAAGVGGDEDRFRSALASISPALAA
jgi:predicted Zn-dependent peptidase